MNSDIIITEKDYISLCELVRTEKNLNRTELNNLKFLGSEIRRAKRLKRKKPAPDFVTMNSEVEIIDLDTSKTMKLKLVYPGEADFRKGKVSVLSMLGSALLGYKAGSTISYSTPAGTKKVTIRSISFPELS
ncbi:MAG: GreA/GreB family elongation factor [Prolixibacteraceae bacterium]|jgi:regulator of nucleoside diphosphate kinase|nr:GreA/GreB family elongation factor [Prolixibacteraceae bacterium]MDD4754466.1 GreA/GreB family elongation factor [Prolixibacteraceae bacterium]NLO02678.1 hypothetical protein [Bacteroidales bacterium]